MEFVIQPTTLEERSVYPMGVPPLVWSPVEARNSTITPTGNIEYPGAERAPRLISIMLVRSREEDLPANAKIFIQLLVYPAILDEAQQVVQPAVYQTLDILTPEHLEWKRQYPIDPNRLSVFKEVSDTPYGAVSFGMFGQQTQQSE